MSIFKVGDFTLNSGSKAKWEIDCDDFTKEDWEALALMVKEQNFDFGRIVPVPKGKSSSPIDNALRFADALQQYITPNSSVTLIIDDVYTTGGSITACRDTLEKGTLCWGVVVFARKPIMLKDSFWVHPIFQFWV